ncbi:metal ABC transporter permease [Limnoglobus roseus]|uniref:Metal ABC transporter permease n=1 Tax=Limnoglobus roseus TaxID=2598579 RepID=A0A5C1APE9_9BACT|nr:metal ABC transporter permease [Limnoglobus roseus]QEL20013.1 metal ABC transporter permease [Limnoglobus roseus]
MLQLFEDFLIRCSQTLGVELHDVNAVLAITTVGIVCGTVGSLVIGNRMSFFSDAMAHCAFAGVALGLLSVLIVDPLNRRVDDSPFRWLVPFVMILFGAAVGVGIAYFRERSSLAADSIIGVFFALAVGFGAMLIPEVNKRGQRFDPEAFLFGSPIFAQAEDQLMLLALAVLVLGFILTRFNSVVFASFSPSLARSRRVSVRLNHYLFVVLLSLVVNLSIKAVGVLLINALLVVPAAAAANSARNVRQLFLMSLLISLGCGWSGYLISRNWVLNLGPNRVFEFRTGGTIVVLTVFCFFVTAFLARLRGRAVHGVDCEC